MDNLPIQTIQTPGVEDLRPGDYVTVSRVTVELPPFMCPPIPGGDGRFSYIPMDAGDPRKVLAVCVPFLLVAMPDGKHETLDVRRHRVVRLPADYGRRSFKRFRKDAQSEHDDSATGPKKD